MRAASRSARRAGSVLATLALSAGFVACGDDDDGGGGGGGGGASGGDIEVGQGITSEPCPGGNAERGCIYLGLISDLTGPFSPLAVPLTEAQGDFWKRVNAQGGIGGKYDVNVTKFTRDNKYAPQPHVAALREIQSEVAGLAQVLGTPATIAGLPLQERGSLVANAGTWWSGWAFDEEDKGLVLESGQPYCVESLNALDYMTEEFGKPGKVLAVGYPGDYGGDSAAGASIWGKENGAEVATEETAPNASAGNQDGVVAAIRREEPDVVLLATGPAEMAEIVGKSVAGGFDGEFIGAVPTYNGAVLKSPAAAAIKAKYRAMAPWGPWGTDTPAHKAMEEARGGEPPENDGYTIGWMWSYPLKAVLDQAAADGDLTPEGLKAAVGKVTVDYEGALPDAKYQGDGNARTVRMGVVIKPDDAAPLGSSIEKDFFTGPTAEKLQLDGPCVAAG